MIDLITTRADVDQETATYARVVIAGIVQATRDLALPPSESERRREINLNEDAIESLDFFYGKNAKLFDYYCELIGIEPDVYRRNMETGRAMDVKNPLYTDQHFRAMRTRIHWWKAYREAVAEAKEKGL